MLDLNILLFCLELYLPLSPPAPGVKPPTCPPFLVEVLPTPLPGVSTALILLVLLIPSVILGFLGERFPAKFWFLYLFEAGLVKAAAFLEIPW